MKPLLLMPLVSALMIGAEGGAGHGPQFDTDAPVTFAVSAKATGTDAVWAVAVSPDGKMLATGDQKGLVKLWELPALSQKAVLREHKGPVYALAFSNDGKRLASAGGIYMHGGETPGEVVIWDLPAERPTARLPGLAGPVYALAFSPDKRTLATGGPAKGGKRDTGEVKLWDLAKLKEPVRPVAPRHAGREVKLCDLPRLKERLVLARHDWGPVSALAFSPDGELLVSGSGTPNGNQYRLWDPASGKELPRPGIEEIRHMVGFARPMAGQCSAAFSPDGKTLFAAGTRGTIRAWDMPSRKDLRSLAGHEQHVNALAVGPKGAVLASVSRDHSVRLWNLARPAECLCLRGHTGSINAVAFAPNGTSLVTADATGMVRLWDVAILLGFKHRQEKRFKGDMAEIQGTWVVAKTLAEGKDKLPDLEKITFADNKLIFHAKVFDGTPAQPPQAPKGKRVTHQLTVIVAIDPSKKPKTIDLTFPGSATPDGKDVLFGQGIYVLEGNNLKLAFMTGNRGDFVLPRGRPTNFEGKDKSTTTILRRP